MTAKKAAKSAEENIARLRATGRNDECPCGSKKKYKKCHLREDEEAERVHLEGIQVANAKAAEKEAKEHDADCKDPECKEDNGKAKAEAPKAKAVAGGGSKPAPKGPAATASQRSMPRKAV